MKILLLYLFFLTGCAIGKEMPEDEMVKWKLVRIDEEMRDNKPIDVEIWEVKGIERRIVGSTGYKVGTVMIWPVQK